MGRDKHSGAVSAGLASACFRLRTFPRTCLIALSLVVVTGVAHARTNAYTQAMADRDARIMSVAREKRSAALSKRHDMKDRQKRADVVRQLQEAEAAHMGAVRRRAAAEGLELEGQWPDGRGFRLIDFDKKGFPVYEEDLNIDAAITTAADLVRDSATFQTSVKVEAEVAYPDNHGGIRLEACSDTGGGTNIAYIENGDWAEYTIDIPAAGQYTLNIRTASNHDDGGSIDLSANGRSIGSVDVPDSNGWQTWTTVRVHVMFATAGTQTLRMDFVGGVGSLFNVNWFSYNRTVMIGHWESGTPRLTHRELAGKVAIMDGTSSTTDHATHVVGTLVSRGINPDTLGMAPEASVASFSSGSATVEMAANGAAGPGTTNIYLSNHSYGVTRGWKEVGGVWQFQGTFVDDDDPSTDYEEDFGRYNSRSGEWDGVAYNLPYYLIFVAAGNGRQNVPGEGETWKHGWNDEYTYDSAKHPAGNAVYKGGWDNMEGGALAKNVIAVGWADEGIDGDGNRAPDEASASKYSCRGPVDDGRIKPDIYGNGSGLTSCTAGSDTATSSYSGTSMSSPSVCGSAALLIGYYDSRFPGRAMRASTLKALILHTADDRLSTGPDYKYGWGIMNTKAAADVITLHAHNQGGGAMLESFVDTNVISRTRTFDWDGTSPLRVTLCWTDPPGAEIDGHDSRAKALVNDLNLKVIGPGGTHYPYVMPHVGDWSEASIDDTATTGVNDVDNVEQVYLATPTSGEYTVVVDYVGPLTNGEQDYSLIVTGQATAGQTELEAWRAEHFGTTNNTGDAAGDFDFDKDGYANLLEFGLATSPKVAESDPMLFAIDAADAKLTYTRNVNALAEYDIEVIWSDDLLSDVWYTAGVTEAILSDDGTVQQVEAALPMGASTARYFRLRMSRK